MIVVMLWLVVFLERSYFADSQPCVCSCTIEKNQTQSCPPGFVHCNNITGECKCSAGTSSEYYGIAKCDNSLQQAYIEKTYWVGYDSASNESEDTLLSGYCAKGFCSPQHGNLLPPVASRALLEEAVCASNRTGVLCGVCEPGYSVQFHSLTLKCEPNRGTVVGGGCSTSSVKSYP